jgi:hypothetical protein
MRYASLASRGHRPAPNVRSLFFIGLAEWLCRSFRLPETIGLARYGIATDCTRKRLRTCSKKARVTATDVEVH